MITMKKIVVCTECKGRGTVKDGNLREMHNHDIAVCTVCGGKKLLERIITIQYQQI